jgi:uncharacterized surface protein with fasciclin (FAS1) repeats
MAAAAARRFARLAAAALVAALVLVAGANAQSQTIFDIVSKDPSFSTLATGMQRAGLAAAFGNPNLSPKVTCFAPTDTAFNAVARRFGVTPEVAFGNRNLLNTVINLHLLPKKLTVSQLRAAPSQDTRAPGYKVNVTPIGANGAAVALRNIANPPAPIVKPNLDASNGIVHGIGGILLPFRLPGTKRM